MSHSATEPTMKALRLLREKAGEAPTLALSAVPKPKLIPHHVLVKVHASAIHPSDVGNAQGLFPYTRYPRIVGRDYAGVVEEGPRELVGLEVYGTSGKTYAFSEDGFQADYCLVHEKDIARKPKNITFAQAATLGVPFTTAALIMERSAIKQSDTVLVIGANGSVGSCVVQLARHKGARVFKASRHPGDDVNTENDPELKALDALTDGRGVDVVVDTVGSPSLMQNAINRLANGGRLAFIAAPRIGATELGIDIRPFYRADLSLLGCNSLNPSAEEMARRLDGLQELFESGSLAPEGKWTQVSLENAVEAYEKLAKKTSTEKYVVVMG